MSLFFTFILTYKHNFIWVFFASFEILNTPEIPSVAADQRPSSNCVSIFQEHWYMSYIDLLQRFELWNVSNEVIKLSTCSAITCLNQTSTTLHINCSNCKRPMSNKGWICDRYEWLGSRLVAYLFFVCFVVFDCSCPAGATSVPACAQCATMWSKDCLCGVRAAVTADTWST